MPKLTLYRLSQLAHLGLRSQLFVPAFLKELHHEIPSIANTFCWQNEAGVLDNIYDETANITIIESFIDSMCPVDRKQKYTRTIEWVSSLTGGTASFDNFGKCPFVADFYKTILLPAGYRNTYFLPIFNNARDKIRLGVLMLHRSRHCKPFNADEKATLKRIGILMGQGLSRPVTEVSRTIEGDEKGMLIIDDRGYVEESCARGDKLLSLASSSQFGQSNSRPNGILGFSGASQLIKETLKQNRYSSNKEKSTLTISNRWGDFVFEGFLIKKGNIKGKDKILINVNWQEPFVIKIFHSIKTLSLTPRQETVALLYAAGDPYQEIADKLKLSLHTVKEHVKDLSKALSIASRADLIELALCNNTAYGENNDNQKR